ncbi:MAG: hypothetical protein WAT77_08690 [Paracoccaceae bacterium]|jgi:hypothetical protein
MNTRKLPPALHLVFSWTFSIATTTAFLAVAMLLSMILTVISAQL